ncbi:MAG: hypothetical protein RIF41_10185 [Polyangiaceae bacterium]
MDRDGWGSAALLVEALGPESCELRPTKSKDVRRIVDGAHPEQHVWVLDIPAPPSWAGWDRRDAETTWVDHHLASWSRPAPMWIRAIVPETDRPTTTMSLLVRHGLASPGTGHELARRLCTRDDDAWGEVFDGLSQQFPDLPVTHQRLPALLEGAPRGGAIPAALEPAAKGASQLRGLIDDVLADAEVIVEPALVVAYLHDAKRVPLARCSLTLGRRHPGRLVAIVHRNQRLYCGRSSQSAGLNLIEHFRARGLDPKGHPYVSTVDVPNGRIADELEALACATGASS